MTEKLFSKNFTLLVFGQVSSLFGNYILKFALSMYVLEVTGSATIFAGILAIATVPTILLSPLGGILADRANRRTIMVALDTSSGLAVCCATLLFSERNGIAMIGVLLVLLSILGAFETPTVQACVPQMLTGDNILKGNAIINQVAAVSALIAPILGSVFYVRFGLRPVMAASILCFFITAFFECFIRLERVQSDQPTNIRTMIVHDFKLSMRFICKEQPGILKLLLLAATVNFFLMGTALVGLPYIIRTTLGLSAAYYGFAESLLGVAAILGSIAAGFLAKKMQVRHLSIILAAFGALLLPAGIVFLIPASTVMAAYTINLAAFFGIQLTACIFSIFAVSLIQQRTPANLIGKVMSYVATITMCTQPFGQMLYGILFDHLPDPFVLIPTAIAILAISLASANLFRHMDSNG